MRDLVLTAFIFGSLPFLLRRPDLAVLMWSWISLMAPHRLTWGFAFNMRFALIVGLVLILGVLISKERKQFPWSPMTVTWVLLAFWMCVTTVFALNPDRVMWGFDKAIKIQITSFIILMVMTTPWRLKAFVVVVALSIGFFGIKGGVFTILSGGSYLVWGPYGSFIADNNALAMALVVNLPLLWFMKLQAPNKWVARAMVVAVILCVFSVIGSNSRGAFLALGAMGLFLLLKSRRRIPLLIGMAILVPIAVSFAPQKYWDRMQTIQTYEEDRSAMGRIEAWQTAINIAKARPLVGGGFETWTPSVWARYGPPGTESRDVHSIYFEVLGEQGIVGFLLFMTLAIMGYLGAGRTARRAHGVPGAQWQIDLGRMVQVSLFGYGVGGAFLGLAYFDLLYNLYAMVILNRVILERTLANEDLTMSAPRRVAPVYGQPNPGTTPIREGGHGRPY